MPDIEEKLVKLLDEVGSNVLEFPTDGFIAALADHLIANGVTIQHAKNRRKESDCGLQNYTTNADRIRAMSDEELTVFINKIVICHQLRNAGNCKYCPIYGAKPCDTEGVLSWLQQPAEEVDHEV